ncbi:MAG: VWA domain-containing protein [Bryobacterales bacterium]|nr:VWA domain-containing protein [Bryobacterales bacterium]
MTKPLALLLTLAFALSAQQEPIRVDVPVVFVPVTVTDSHGRYLNNLDAPDFELADNGKPVPFSLTTSDSLSAPLALAVLVQANEPAVTAIEKIRKVGSVVHALVAGQRGSVMLMAYGDEIKTIQPWTRDPDSLSASFKSLRPQWTAKARILDAVTAAVDELARRAPEERRVLLIIGEAKDRGSKTDVLAAIEAASRAGVIIHGVTFSAYATAFTRKGEVTLTTTGGFNVLGLSEIDRLGKENTMEMLPTPPAAAAASPPSTDSKRNSPTPAKRSTRSTYSPSHRKTPPPASTPSPSASRTPRTPRSAPAPATGPATPSPPHRSPPPISAPAAS